MIHVLLDPVDWVPTDLIAAALKPNGRLLRSFADGGKLVTRFGTEDDYRGDDVLFQNGKLLVSGTRIVYDDDSFRYSEAKSDMFVARFLIE